MKKVALHHLSWSQVLSEAVMQKDHRGVADPDQAWILGELIRYLEHPRSGALEFDDMGASWVGVRDAVAASTLRPTDKLAPEVAARFDALLRYASLRLGRQLGTDVTPVLGRKEAADPAVRSQVLVSSLVDAGTLTGAIRIPHTVGHLVVTADLRAGKVTCHVDVAAPGEGRATTRVNWLIRQVKEAPGQVRVEATSAHSRGASSAGLLRDIRENPSVLVPDATRELRMFRVALDRPLGAKRGRGRGSFIDSVLLAVDDFYGEVLQNIKAWTATPPKVRDPGETPPVPPALISTALSSQDGTEEVIGDVEGEDSVEAAEQRSEVDRDAHGSGAVAVGIDNDEDEAPPQWTEYNDTEATGVRGSSETPT
jgi:hypothetical protein